MPPTNLNIRRLADGALGGTGCLYTGPTSIEFLSNGKIKVKSPYTRSTNAGCIGGSAGTATEVTGPGERRHLRPGRAGRLEQDPNYRADCGAAEPMSEYTFGHG